MRKSIGGISHIEISCAQNDRSRVKLILGSFPGAVVAPFADEPEEGIEISVLVDTQANPRLLNVEFAALKRARDMIAEQMKGLQGAIGNRTNLRHRLSPSVGWTHRFPRRLLNEE